MLLVIASLVSLVQYMVLPLLVFANFLHVSYSCAMIQVSDELSSSKPLRVSIREVFCATVRDALLACYVDSILNGLLNFIILKLHKYLFKHQVC